MLLHIGSFHLDIDSQRVSPWHRLVPQTRLLCVLLAVLAIVLTPNGQWITWGCYGVAVLALVLMSRVTLPVLLQRLAVESAFLTVVILGTLFHEGGQTLWQWGWLRITTTGLTILGSVALKGVLSLIILNVLSLTTPVPDLLYGLQVLRVPPLLIAILASMYRYLGVLVEEFNAMRRAAQSRNLMGNRHWQRMVIGNMFGSLFIRTLDRGDRIHRAMLSRGYSGLPPQVDIPQPSRFDTFALSLSALIALLGQGMALI